MNPEIQYFAESGTWVKPAGAVRVDIMIRGGDGHGAIPVLGTKIGAPGELLASSIDAGDLPDTVEVTVGNGGRSGGRDGYALIVTHLAEDPPMTGPGGRWRPVSELAEHNAVMAEHFATLARVGRESCPGPCPMCAERDAGAETVETMRQWLEKDRWEQK